MKNLKIETIAKLLNIIDSLAICHLDMVKPNKLPDEAVKAHLDRLTSELHEAIKEDVAEQLEVWRQQNFTAAYVEWLEKQLEEGCVHPHHEQAFQSSLQAERDFYGLDD
jgi:hypothetical protein